MATSSAEAKRDNARKALTSGETDEWYTPEPVLEVVRKVGIIGLDPFWSPRSHVRPLLGLTKRENSLTRDWLELMRWVVENRQPAETPIVYCNPPYSIMELCAPKIVHEARRGLEVVSLVKAATETEWFDTLAWRSARVACFLGSRLKHTNGDRLAAPADGKKKAKGTATFASVLLYHGVRVRRFAAAAAPLGKIILLNGGGV